LIYLYSHGDRVTWNPPSAPQTEENARAHDFLTEKTVRHSGFLI